MIITFIVILAVIFFASVSGGSGSGDIPSEDIPEASVIDIQPAYEPPAEIAPYNEGQIEEIPAYTNGGGATPVAIEEPASVFLVRSRLAI